MNEDLLKSDNGPTPKKDGRKIDRGNLGIYSIIGGPGRPKGSVSKAEKLKQALIDTFFEENGKEKFKQLLVDEKGRLSLRALDRIISILPKETVQENQEQNIKIIVHKNNTNINFIKNLEEVPSEELKEENNFEQEKIKKDQDPEIENSQGEKIENN